MSNGAQDRTALLKTRILIACSVIGQVAGNALLSHGLHHQETGVSSSFFHYVYAIANPWAIAGVVVLCGWMISNLSLLSRADLSYILPITGSMSFILIALVGHFLLHENVSWVHWVGICVITIGVLLVLETSPLTVTVHEAPEDER
jgi:drug/metabolite transporter (DMT)-like permease